MNTDDLESLTSITWEARLNRGIEAERAFDAEMRRRGWHCIELKPIHRDDTQERHCPDIAVLEVPGKLWQIKDGRRSGDWPTVIAETQSVAGAQYATEQGYTVVFAWWMPDGSFFGQTYESLTPAGYISDEARKHGSGTPATKFPKDILLPIETLLEDLGTRLTVSGGEILERDARPPMRHIPGMEDF